MDKFNPFKYIGDHPEMDPEGLSNEELEIAKNEAGVVSEFEHYERMIKSGDSLLIQEGLVGFKKIIDEQQKTIEQLELKKPEKMETSLPSEKVDNKQRESQIKEIETDKHDFIDQLKSFGIEDDRLLKKILAYGNIGGIEEIGSSRLEIFFPGKNKRYIAIDKIPTRKIDPTTNETLGETIEFRIDNNPRINHSSSSPSKKLSQEQIESDSSLFG